MKACIAAIFVCGLVSAAYADERVTSLPSETPATFTPTNAGFDYVKREEMIPMRDGVKLKTFILIPKGAKNAPMLLTRTPYDAGNRVLRFNSPHMIAAVPQMNDTAVEAGYIIVFQDVRGKYGSEGDYVMTRPLHGPANPTEVDHATDCYDTIEWLVKNVPESNGRVGTFGGSYEGYTTVMSTVHPHPALKVAVPFAPMVDGWMGDDWFHNGAFRQLGALEYTYDQQATRKGDDKWWSGEYDAYDTYLRAGSAGALAQARGLDQLGFLARARGAHELRLVVADPGGRQGAGERAAHRADDDRLGPVRSGRHLWRSGAVQGARAEGSARRAAAPRARAVESRPGPARRPRHRRDPVRRRHRRLVPPHRDAAVPRSLSEGRAAARNAARARLRDGRQRVAQVR